MTHRDGEEEVMKSSILECTHIMILLVFPRVISEENTSTKTPHQMNRALTMDSTSKQNEFPLSLVSNEHGTNDNPNRHPSEDEGKNLLALVEEKGCVETSRAPRSPKATVDAVARLGGVGRRSPGYLAERSCQSHKGSPNQKTASGEKGEEIEDAPGWKENRGFDVGDFFGRPRNAKMQSPCMLAHSMHCLTFEYLEIAEQNRD